MPGMPTGDSDITIEYKVRDVYGNLVNEPDIHEYQQFREFFTQRIKPNSRAPFDGQFMDKEKRGWE